MNDYNVINSPKIKGSDWNASEGENGYIKNRTHYETVTVKGISTTITIPNEWEKNDEGPEYICTTYTADSDFLQFLYDIFIADIEESTNIPIYHSSGKVIINGTERDCYYYIYATPSSDHVGYQVFCFDSKDISFDNDLPYQNLYLCVSATKLDGGFDYVEYYNNTNYIPIGENNIEISVSTTEVKKLDPKYLPEMKSLSNIKDAENGGIIEGLVEDEEGEINVASGHYAHAEGQGTTASGTKSHAEGYSTTASGEASHSEGSNTRASGEASHSEGNFSFASGQYSHAEGNNTVANHASQHVFGERNIEDPSTAGVESRGTYVEIVGNGNGSKRSNARTLDWNGNEVLAGKLTVGTQPTDDNDVATKKYVDENSGGLNNIKDAENGGIIEGFVNGKEGQINAASGMYAHAEGAGTKASGVISHAEGTRTTASAPSSHAEGSGTTASASSSHAEGTGTTASGQSSHAEGVETKASGQDSHAEGNNTTANHAAQHVFGEFNIEDPSTEESYKRGNYVEIVGNGSGSDTRSNARTLDWSGNEWLTGKLTVGTQPTEDNDVATKKYVDDGDLNNIKDAENGGIIEGLVQVNTARGQYAHAEGSFTIASAPSSHAEGKSTNASGQYSHAEGDNASASGQNSHAEGVSTRANHKSQHVFGEYNIEDPSTANATDRGNYVEIVGNGTSFAKSNARTLDWNGNEWLAGNLTINGTPTEDNHAVTKAYVDAHSGGTSSAEYYFVVLSASAWYETPFGWYENNKSSSIFVPVGYFYTAYGNEYNYFDINIKINDGGASFLAKEAITQDITVYIKKEVLNYTMLPD